MEAFNIIREVRKRPALWNKFDERNRNRNFVDSEWEKVARIANVTKEEAKNKWKNLRDSYVRELKKVPKFGDRKWCYFSHMDFLSETYHQRETEQKSPHAAQIMYWDDSQYNAEQPEHIDQQPIEVIVTPRNEPIYLAGEEEIFRSSNLPKPIAKTPRKKVVGVKSTSNRRLVRSGTNPVNKNLKEVKNQITQLKKNTLQMEKNKQKMKDSKDKFHQDLMFLRSLIPHFRKMKNVQKLKIQNEIMSIILRELENDDD